MKYLDIIAPLLLVLAGLTWGLIGLFDVNIVSFVVGGTGIDRVIYIIMGLSALWQCYSFKRFYTF